MGKKEKDVPVISFSEEYFDLLPMTALQIIGGEGNAKNSGMNICKYSDRLAVSTLRDLNDEDLSSFLGRIELSEIEQNDLESFLQRMEGINNTARRRIKEELEKRNCMVSRTG